MKRKYIVIVFMALCAGIISQAYANSALISGYVSAPPQTIIRQVGAKKPTVGGVPFTYGGFLDFSNNDGFISLPKHHSKPDLRIVVCQPEHLVLIKPEGETISHPELTSNNNALLYRVSKHHDDKNDWYYKAAIEKAPADNRLCSNDLIIFTRNPQSIFINTHESFFTADVAQFTIPSRMITVLWNTNPDVQALTRYLQPIELLHKEQQEQGSDKTPITQVAVNPL